MAQIFDSEQEQKIAKGKSMHTMLVSTINEALNRNDQDLNYVISSPPGMAKTYETKLALANCTDIPLVFEGTASFPAFAIEFATAVYLHEQSGNILLWQILLKVLLHFLHLQ